MWSTLVLFLGADYGLTPAQKLTLVSVAAGCGALLRVPCTFAVTVFGGRDWTIVSAGLLLVPCALTAALLTPGVAYATMLILAAVGGVGGGNFASSMIDLNAFYPIYVPLIVVGMAGAALDMDNLAHVGNDNRGLADRLGGARVTFVNFIFMAASAVTVLVASKQHSLLRPRRRGRRGPRIHQAYTGRMCGALIGIRAPSAPPARSS